jgi:hypothetical protein
MNEDWREGFLTGLMIGLGVGVLLVVFFAA